jgi:AcrR family transcriptional regulator
VSGLAGELAEWVSSVGSGVSAGLGDGGSACACGQAAAWSSGRARLGSERARILRATGEVVAGDGYARLTAEKVADRAGVSERALLEAYGDVRECFLDAFDLVGFEALISAARVSRGAGDGLPGVCRGIGAMLEHVACDPVLRAVAFVELSAAGPLALERRERLLDGCTALLAKGVGGVCRPSEVALQACVGGVWGVVQQHAQHDAEQLLPSLAPQIAYAALAPLVGGEQAVQAIRAVWR